MIKEPPKPTVKLNDVLFWYGLIAIVASTAFMMCGKPGMQPPVKEPVFINQADAGE